MTGALSWRKLTIEHAVHASTDAAFGPSQTIRAISGYVEAPTITGDCAASTPFATALRSEVRVFDATHPTRGRLPGK